MGQRITSEILDILSIGTDSKISRTGMMKVSRKSVLTGLLEFLSKKVRDLASRRIAEGELDGIDGAV
jgi:hypothetical protein